MNSKVTPFSSVKGYFVTTDDLANAMKNDDKVFLYSRGSDPTVDQFNNAMADLENKDAAVSFASGAGAISAVLLSLLKSGDHVIYNQRSYSWARHLMKNHLKRFGVDCTEVPDTDFGNVAKYIRPNTKLIYVETPTYFFFEDLNLKTLFSTAKKQNIITVLDNTYFGPNNLKPDYQNFDVVLHSTTKMICGDGKALGGVACTNHDLRKKIFIDGLMSLGSVMSSVVASKMLEGLSSYNERAERVSSEMKPLINFLQTDSRVKKVHYPWTLNKTNEWSEHEHAKFPVGLLSIQLATENSVVVKSFCESLRLVKMAVSYGSKEALIMPSLIFAHKTDLHFPMNMCRISIGEQSGAAVAADIKQSLDKAFGNSPGH